MTRLKLGNKGLSLTSILLILIVLLFGFIMIRGLQKPRDIQPKNQRFEIKPEHGLPRPVIRSKKKHKPKEIREIPKGLEF